MEMSDDLDILLRKVCKVHTNKVNKILDEVGLHIGQPMLLRSLHKKGGVPQSVLAKELEITPATTSTMVKRLEKGGYVIRKRDAVDERVSNIYLTDKGREIGSKLEGLQQTMEKIVFNGFSEDEKKIMRLYLERMIDNMAD